MWLQLQSYRACIAPQAIIGCSWPGTFLAYTAGSKIPKNTHCIAIMAEIRRHNITVPTRRYQVAGGQPLHMPGIFQQRPQHLLGITRRIPSASFCDSCVFDPPPPDPCS